MLRLLLFSFTCSHWFCAIAGDYTFSDARNRFKNTLLVVKYNYKAPPGPVLLHIRMWSKVFVNQLIFLDWSETEIAEFTTKNLRDSRKIAVAYKQESKPPGFYAYDVVSLAMKSHPHYEGYLFAHDDMAMNITALIDFDLSSSWQTEWESQCKDLDPFWNVTKNGWWWDGESGTRAIDKMLANSSNTVIANEMKVALGSNHYWCGDQSDFFYITQKFRELYIRVMDPFADAGIFLEIAVPTFFRAYIPPDESIKVPLCTTFLDAIRLNNTLYEFMETQCGDKYPLFHPIKLSSKPNVDRMRKKMALIGY